MKPKKSNKLPIKHTLMPLAGLVVLLAIYLGSAKVFNFWPFSNTTIEIQQIQATAQDHQKKTDTIDSVTNKGAAADPKDQGNYTPPVSSQGITLTPKQDNSSQVSLTTKLSGYSDGTCSLTVANGDKSVTQTATVIYQSQFSTCAGFTIPVSSLGTGTWQFNLTVTSGGNTTSKEATLGVQ
ncbi:MAG: hypothetical protein ABI220_00335 [Candidatus Saccharimonadales bacterium]